MPGLVVVAVGVPGRASLGIVVGEVGEIRASFTTARRPMSAGSRGGRGTRMSRRGWRHQAMLAARRSLPFPQASPTPRRTPPPRSARAATGRHRTAGSTASHSFSIRPWPGSNRSPDAGGRPARRRGPRDQLHDKPVLDEHHEDLAVGLERRRAERPLRPVGPGFDAVRWSIRTSASVVTSASDEPWRSRRRLGGLHGPRSALRRQAGDGPRARSRASRRGPR